MADRQPRLTTSTGIAMVRVTDTRTGHQLSIALAEYENAPEGVFKLHPDRDAVDYRGTILEPIFQGSAGDQDETVALTEPETPAAEPTITEPAIVAREAKLVEKKEVTK